MKEKPLPTETQYIASRIQGYHELKFDRDTARSAYEQLLVNARD